MVKAALLIAATLAPTASGFSAGGYLTQLDGVNGGMSPNGAGRMMQDIPPMPSAPMSPPARSSFDAQVPPPSGARPSQELLELWSAQVSVELSASQLYLSASIWFNAREMPGMAAWMLDESGEEREHGLGILEYANKRKFPVVLEPLDAPINNWQNPTQVWEDILLAEQTNTQNLLRLAAVANACGDYSAMAFLNSYHIEQTEAEDTVSGILAKVREATPALLRQLDHELGQEAEEGH